MPWRETWIEHVAVALEELLGSESGVSVVCMSACIGSVEEESRREKKVDQTDVHEEE